jgi:hypothetical protein
MPCYACSRINCKTFRNGLLLQSNWKVLVQEEEFEDSTTRMAYVCLEIQGIEADSSRSHGSQGSRLINRAVSTGLSQCINNTNIQCLLRAM